MENNTRLGGSNPEVMVEADVLGPPSPQNETVVDIDDEEIELANALFRSDFITMECLAWTSLSVAIVELILLFVVFILILNKY